MWVKFLDHQLPVKIRSDILKYGVDSKRETDGLRLIVKDRLWRVHELHFVSNSTDTAVFFARNFEIVLRIGYHEKHDHFPNLYLTSGLTD